MKRVLIIEDDADIATLLRHALERDGTFEVEVADNGASGLDSAIRRPPDVVLLDLNLPEVDGLDVCRKLRATEATARLPLIVVTARTDESDRVSGLELGADDYIVKPFSVREVVARVRAVLRRSAPAGDGGPRVLDAGGIRLDESRRRVEVDGCEVALTRKEFDLLAELIRNRGRVLSRERILRRVWGYDHPGATRTVDVHVRQLRRKLGDRAARSIDTVVGIGYRFAEEPA